MSMSPLRITCRSSTPDSNIPRTISNPPLANLSIPSSQTTKRRALDGDKQKATLPTSLPARRAARTLTDRIAAAEAGKDPRAVKKVRLGVEQITAQLKNVTHKLDPCSVPNPSSTHRPQHLQPRRGTDTGGPNQAPASKDPRILWRGRLLHLLARRLGALRAAQGHGRRSTSKTTVRRQLCKSFLRSKDISTQTKV